jgi:hypothetical protein
MVKFYAEAVVWAKTWKVRNQAVDRAIQRLAFYTDILGDAKLRDFTQGILDPNTKPFEYKDGIFLRTRPGISPSRSRRTACPSPLPVLEEPHDEEPSVQTRATIRSLRRSPLGAGSRHARSREAAARWRRPGSAMATWAQGTPRILGQRQTKLRPGGRGPGRANRPKMNDAGARVLPAGHRRPSSGAICPTPSSVQAATRPIRRRSRRSTRSASSRSASGTTAPSELPAGVHDHPDYEPAIVGVCDAARRRKGSSSEADSVPHPEARSSCRRARPSSPRWPR